MKKLFVFLFAVLLVPGVWCDTEVTIRRADSKINAGFRERIFVDGREVLVLTNGSSGKVSVSDGSHTIHAELYTLTTAKLDFTARGGSIQFVVTPRSTRNFVIEQITTIREAQIAEGGVEGSLLLASEKIMEKIPARAKIAIVYVTSNDEDVTEFIAGELEFIMVEEGMTLIDRSQLDKIRKEQNLQMSGEVDDDHAVSIGKIAGASVIITGAVTGSGSLRRLRLRALDTQTAQVLSAASERY
jgi:hypothetical protein